MQPGELNSSQITAITALVSGENYKDAADSAGVTETTLRRWRRENQGFISELRNQKKELLGQTTSKIADAAAESIATLTELRDDGDEKGSVRVRAASKLLDLAIQVGEIEVLQAEIEDLKARLDAMGK